MAESIPPLAVGVCSWSLQVTGVAELERLCGEVGVDVVQIACGDPHHAVWDEGDDLPAEAKGASFRMASAMIGFPGEDYTTPATIKATGGFGDPATRGARLETFRWAVERTRAFGLDALLCHAGFLPDEAGAERDSLFDCLAEAADVAAGQGVTMLLETGQETADTLKDALDAIAKPNLMVNFDPANMLLYDMGEPVVAIKTLGSYVAGVHLKDADRPTQPGQWGTEVPLGQGQADIPAVLKALREIGYSGSLCIEREVGTQEQRIADVRQGAEYVRTLLTQMG